MARHLDVLGAVRQRAPDQLEVVQRQGCPRGHGSREAQGLGAGRRPVGRLYPCCNRAPYRLAHFLAVSRNSLCKSWFSSAI